MTTNFSSFNQPATAPSKHRILCSVVLGILALAEIAMGTDYFIDSQSGDDSRSGSSRHLAWKSLIRVNQQKFEPGDRILFKSGTVQNGQLAPLGSGTVKKPIFIGKYGGDRMPRIDGNGLVADTLLLRNVEFWQVRDLEITNHGENRAPWRTGVRISAEDFGTMRHIHLRNLLVRDVNGDLRKSHEGCGILFESLGRKKPSRFDDLRVENCHLVRTDRNGICQRNGSGPHSTQVVIRGNLLEDIGGDGIKPWGSDAPLVEHNIIRGGRMRCEDAAAGIWPFDCNDALIQFNEVSGMKGTLDGQGFDADYMCRRSIFQYNYSHDNEGGFILVCSPGNSFNDGTVIRYNISQNDGIGSARVFHFGGGSSNTLVHNNTIYLGPDQALPMLLFSEWNGGRAKRVRFFNNLFYVDGQVSYRWDGVRDVEFSHNVFYGKHTEIPRDPSAITTRPALRDPGSGRNGFASLDGYRPVPGQSLPRGRIIEGHGGRDFFGNPLPTRKAPCIGAVEASE